MVNKSTTIWRACTLWKLEINLLIRSFSESKHRKTSQCQIKSQNKRVNAAHGNRRRPTDELVNQYHLAVFTTIFFWRSYHFRAYFQFLEPFDLCLSATVATSQRRPFWNHDKTIRNHAGTIRKWITGTQFASNYYVIRLTWAHLCVRTMRCTYYLSIDLQFMNRPTCGMSCETKACSYSIPNSFGIVQN